MFGFVIDSSAVFDNLKQFAEGGISASEVQHRALQDYKDQIRLLDSLGMHHSDCTSLGNALQGLLCRSGQVAEASNRIAAIFVYLEN